MQGYHWRSLLIAIFAAVLLTACGELAALLKQAQGSWLGEYADTAQRREFGDDGLTIGEWSERVPVKKFRFIEIGEKSITLGDEKHACEFDLAADGKTLKVINPQERLETLKLLGAAGQKIGDLPEADRDSLGVVARITFNGDKMVITLRNILGESKPLECRRATRQEYEAAVKAEYGRVATDNKRIIAEREAQAAQVKVEREAQAAQSKAEREENARQVAAQKAEIAQIKKGMTRGEVIKILGNDYQITAGDLKGEYLDRGYVLLAWKLIGEITPFGGRRDGYATVTFDPQDKVADFYGSVNEFVGSNTVETHLTDEELTRQRREQGAKAAKIKGGMTPDAVMAILGENCQKINWGTLGLTALAWKTVGADEFYHAVVFNPANQTYDDEVKWRVPAAQVAEKAIKK